MKVIKVIGPLGGEAVSQFINAFYAAKVEEVHVVINSEGGDSDVYLAFYDCSRRFRRAGMLTTTALGEVDSGACVLVASGSKGRRFSYAHTIWGMHEPFLTSVTADPAVQDSEFDSKKFTLDKYYSLLGEITGTRPNRWRKRLGGKSMVTFGAKTALKWRLIDEILK